MQHFAHLLSKIADKVDSVVYAAKLFGLLHDFAA